MASLLLSAPDTASRYEYWRQHFLDNRDGWRDLPWGDSGSLSDSEVRCVGWSIQQFQLGEFARGRGLTRRAASHPALGGDTCFLQALELFIAEEQGHSGMLGRFLDREGIPRLRRHWVDGVFRRVRKLAGLEACAMTLVTAEVLAIPFYQALRDATRSKLLRSICARILCDEAAHLNYQALTIGLIRRPLSDRARAIRAFCHSILFHGTALLLWQQHDRVFRAAGWDFGRFWNGARRVFRMLETQIRRVDCLDEMRLD